MAIAIRRILPATLTLALTAGCQVSPPLHALKQPLFALGQAPSGAPVLVAPATVGHLGQLTVSFQGELARLAAQRRVQATVADVDKVVITVKPTGGAEVIKLSPSGDTLATYVVPEDALPKVMGSPIEGGIAIDAQGDVWFASTKNDAVYKLVL